MSAPVFLAASSGQAPQASQINQFLLAHPATMVYTGAQRDNQSTAGSGAVNSNSLYIAQKFTAAATYTTGRVVLTLAVTGTPGPWSLSLQSDNAGAPSGTVLAGPVALTYPFVSASAAAISIPLPGAAIASGTVYWIVANAAGDVSDLYSWSKSNQSSGASTSTNGSTWSTQAYGLLFQVRDNTVVAPLLHTREDSAARWTTLGTNVTSGALTSLSEYTVAQAAGDYVSSVRTLTYTDGLLTSIT